MADHKPMDLLKKDLKNLLDRIVVEEDFDFSTADEAIEKLTALKISKIAAASPESGESSGSTTLVLPEMFLCPISGEFMKDPVLLQTGQTYDRSSIEKWFHKGHNTCPKTKEVLSDMTLTPNLLLRSMMMQWYAENGLPIPDVIFEEAIAYADESRLDELLNKLLSQSLSDQKEAAKELRRIARLNHEFRALFANLPGSIERLLHPLSVENVNLHPDLQEDLITTVLNISIHDANKKYLAEEPLVLPLLIQSLQYGSIEVKANAAAAIFSLAFHEANKNMIGNAGALKHLILLLDEGHPVVIRDAASAIFQLCTTLENKEKAVCSGAVGSIVRNISQGIMVDELVSVLALLSTNLKAIDEMCKLKTVPCMLRIMRKTTSQGVKENCASILFIICTADRSKWTEIQDDENANGTIFDLSQTGTSRARRKALGILEKLRRAAAITHTA